MKKLYDAGNILDRIRTSTIAVIAFSVTLLLLSTTFVNSTYTYAQTPTTDDLLDRALRSLTRPNHDGYSYDSEQEKIMFEAWIPLSK
jgi:hypothetical protein